MLTQEAMAQMIGARRNSVSLVANTLQQANFIHYSRGHIQILNLDGLGFGPPHYLLAEVPVVGLPSRFDRRMLALAETVAGRLENPATGIALPGPTDGLAFLTRGFRGLTVVGCQPTGRLPFWHQPGDTPDHVDFPNAEAGVEFAWRLLRAMAEQLRDSL